jgi:flavin reductase (DIM6/NTAB) family NADH-FMN oxidoreductase RutF
LGAARQRFFPLFFPLTMHDVELDKLTPSQRYKLITGSVMPRPIALITTENEDGSCNAAPYSAFNYMSEEPPLVAVGIERYGDESHRPGEIKDTLRNVLRTGEFVINMVDRPLLEQMVGCSTDYPYGISEAKELGLQTAPSKRVRAPRLSQAPISLECRKFEILEYSDLRAILLGEIVSIHFSEGMLNPETLRVNVDSYFPMCRLGGPNYAESTVRVRLQVKPYSSQAGTPRT